MELVGAEAEFAAAAAQGWLRRRRRSPFAALALAVQRRVIQAQLHQLGCEPGFAMIEALRVATGGASLSDPGCTWSATPRVGSGWHWFAARIPRRPAGRQAGASARRGSVRWVALRLDPGCGGGRLDGCARSPDARSSMPTVLARRSCCGTGGRATVSSRSVCREQRSSRICSPMRKSPSPSAGTGLSPPRPAAPFSGSRGCG